MPRTRLVVNRWIRNYAKAWQKKDAKAIASLFTEDATYHSHPFRPVNQGRKSILDYTLGALDVGKCTRFDLESLSWKAQEPPLNTGPQ